MTTISVIIPAYNAQNTIVETVESVRQQTFQDLEIIVIDDGSQDRTCELLATISDKRLKVYSHPNKGVSTARNIGIARAQGEYISFIDADDLWTVDKLEKQLATLQANPEASVAYSWIVVMLESPDNRGQVNLFPGKKIPFTGNIYPKLLLDNFIGNGSNILAKAEAIKSVGEFEPSFTSCEDWDYYLRLANRYNFALVPEHQIFYRKTSVNATSQGEAIEREGLKAIDRIFQSVPQKYQRLKNQSFANFYRYCGKIYVDNSIQKQDLQKGRIRLFKAIYLNPLILFSSEIYTLLFTILLKQFLPASAVKKIVPIVKKPFKIKHFRKTL